MKKYYSILMLSIMVLYVFIPCISEAAPVFTNPKNLCHDAYHGANSIQPTATITYFYSGSTFMNAEDDNGNMSTYLGRTVRTIVNVNTQSIVDTQCLFTDGKNVISQTDSTGTTVTSTQQYNPFGQPVNYNPNTNSQLSIATNPFAYDGYYYDPESGHYYLNARYYSPTLMQFISMDSYDLANRYAYCDGNPIANEDPTGHDAEKFFEDLGEGLVPFGLYFIINGYASNNKSQVKAGWITFGVTAVSSIISGIIGGYLAKKTVTSIVDEGDSNLLQVVEKKLSNSEQIVNNNDREIKIVQINGEKNHRWYYKSTGTSMGNPEKEGAWCRFSGFQFDKSTGELKSLEKPMLLEPAVDIPKGMNENFWGTVTDVNDITISRDLGTKNEFMNTLYEFNKNKINKIEYNTHATFTLKETDKIDDLLNNEEINQFFRQEKAGNIKYLYALDDTNAEN